MKIGKMSHKNGKIFLKMWLGRTDNCLRKILRFFLRKIWRFLHENLTVLQKNLNRQMFLYRPSDFPVKIGKLSYKNRKICQFSPENLLFLQENQNLQMFL